MLYRDADGFIVDQTGDGGDTANRTGLWQLFSRHAEDLDAFEFFQNGILVRHPKQHPWDNPWNFSRDQLIPFVAGCWKQGRHDIVSRVFWRHCKRFFFCQNFERDAHGSTKYPWPHDFINDHGETERRQLDFADPLFPNDIWHLILCAKIKPLYFLAPVGYLFLTLAIIFHGLFNKSDDEGQIISQAVVGGRFFVWLYKKLKPNYQSSLYRYWVQRRTMYQMYETVYKNF